MKQCQIGKCTNVYDYHHYNYVKGLHIKYCNDCYENILRVKYE